MSKPIKYKNYTISKLDELNWIWQKTETRTASKDQKNPRTGELIRKAGETYEAETKPKFYGDIGSALAGVVRDLAGVDCADIAALARQLDEITSELGGLTK